MNASDPVAVRDETVPLAYADPALRRQQRIDAARGFLRQAFNIRQLVFAAGMALTLGSLGYAVGNYTRTLSETPVCTTIGGLLLGFAIPIRSNASA